MRKILKILLYTVLAILIFFASISFALRFSKVQTYVTQKITSSLENDLQTKINIDKVDITWYFNVLIEDIEIYDQHQKILFAAESIEVDASLLRLFTEKIKITEAIINNAELNLIVVDGELNLNYLVEHFKNPKADSTSNFEIDFVDIELNNFKFTQLNSDKELLESGFDPNNIQIYFSQIKVADFFFRGSEFGGYFENIRAEEKSGLKINKAYGNLVMSDVSLKSDSFYILTDYSELKTILNWEYEDWKSYSDFVNEVEINTSFKNSGISTSDLAFFSPALKNTSDLLSIDGDISGSIANLKSKNLILNIDNKLNFIGELKINGLPDIYNSFIMLKIESLETSSTQLNSLSIFKKNDLVMPEQLKNLGNININGRFTGFYKDFVSNAVFKTKQGTIKTNLLLKPMKGDNVLAYQGQFSTVNFNVGKMLGNKAIGKITMKADVNGENFDKTAKLETKINISSIGFDDNIYKNISINGDLANQIFNAEINSKDKKFALAANASYQIKPDYKILNIDMDIDNARISRLFMVDEDTLGNISGNLNINIKGNRLNDFTGDIKFENPVYTNLDKDIEHNLQDININSVPFDDGRNIKVRSEFVDADFNIGSELTSLNMIYYDIMNNVLPSLIKGDKLSDKLQSNEKDRSILAKINIKNIDLLTEISNTDISISPNTTLNAYYSNYKNQFDIKIKGEQINFNGKILNDYNIHVYNENDILKLNSFAENLKLSDSIFLDSLIANSSINGDMASYSIKWGNNNKELSALFEGNLSFTDSSIINIFNDNYLWVNNNLWKIDSTNRLKYSKKDISINNFIIESEKSGLFVNGNLNNEGDKLNIKFKKIDLSVANAALEQSGTSINGIIDGELSISNPWNDIIINSALKIEKLSLNDTYIGETTIDMEWKDASKAINTELKALNNGKKIMFVSGSIFPLDSKSNFDLLVNLTDFPANALKPYLVSFSSNIEGYTSGEVSLKGKFSDPKLKGYVDADISKFKIDYLNTEYSFKHRLNIESTSIKASKIKMYDRLFESESKGHYATADFEFWFKNSFKDMGVDLNIDANNILALDLEPDMNEFFYGKAFASGKISITGPFDDLVMDVNIETESGTVVSLPYSDKETAENASFINFVNPNDSLSNSDESNAENIFDDSGISMNFNFIIKPNATLRMVMNERTGDVLTASGNSNLKIDVDKQLNIGMFGTFEVTKGVYNYSFEGIFNKKFNIREGGTISWAGDLMDAKMDLQAIHQTNAPLHDLLQFIDSSAVYKRPSKVNAIINIDGRLMNPKISFDIELPDEDENTKELVRNVLYISEDQPNTSLINMNFISLLVLNKFQPPTGFSGQQNAFGASNATDFLTQQIGNLLGGFSNDLDVGIDYQLDNEVTSKQLAVALSYSLLDDRLIINGKFGSGGEAKGSEESRFVGDFLVEYKITSDGNIRARVFNRTNYDDALNKRAPYTQGVGISFTRSVDTFKEIFKKAK